MSHHHLAGPLPYDDAALAERRDAWELCVKRHPNSYDEEQRALLSREHALSV